MILAALVFIRKVTLTTTVTRVTEDDLEDGRMHVLQGKDIPPFVAIYRIHGPFLFGATEKIDEIRRELPSLPSIVVLRLRNMTAIDSTGLQALERLALEVRGSGRTLLLCGAREQPRRLMGQASFAQHVGEENICAHVSAALERANAIHDQAASGVLST
jgi:SulP family sulfate permease